jgi:hypothetical protein
LENANPLLFDQLLGLGQQGNFDAVSLLPGAGIHSHVLRIADRYRDALLKFFVALDPPDKLAMAKAVAVYEDTVGGLGSVTTLRYLLEKIDDPRHELLDWILQNTNSYWYYCGSARSYEQYAAWKRWRHEAAAANIARDEERQQRDRLRIAMEATGKLTNAVRRGDTKAVQALLLKGADSTVLSSEGRSLRDVAAAAGRLDIVAMLEGHFRNKSPQ